MCVAVRFQRGGLSTIVRIMSLPAFPYNLSPCGGANGVAVYGDTFLVVDVCACILDPPEGSGSRESWLRGRSFKGSWCRLSEDDRQSVKRCLRISAAEGRMLHTSADQLRRKRGLLRFGTPRAASARLAPRKATASKLALTLSLCARR